VIGTIVFSRTPDPADICSMRRLPRNIKTLFRWPQHIFYSPCNQQISTVPFADILSVGVAAVPKKIGEHTKRGRGKGFDSFCFLPDGSAQCPALLGIWIHRTEYNYKPYNVDSR
jgi:hypothetical protein